MEANRNRPELLERFWRLNPVPVGGEVKAGRRRLTDDDVCDIRDMYFKGTPQVVIARVYGVNESTIYRVCARETYRWVK